MVKTLPCSIYNIPAMESWLEAQARQGRHFSYFCGYWAVFDKGAPREDTYRLELIGGQKPGDPEVYEAAGWEQVACDWNENIKVLRAARPDPVPLYASPEDQALGGERLRRRLRRRFLPYCAVCVAWVVLLGIAFRTGRTVDLTYAFPAIFWTILTGEDLAALVRLMRSLKDGVFPERRLGVPIRGWLVWGMWIGFLVVWPAWTFWRILHG